MLVPTLGCMRACLARSWSRWSFVSFCRSRWSRDVHGRTPDARRRPAESLEVPRLNEPAKQSLPRYRDRLLGSSSRRAGPSSLCRLLYGSGCTDVSTSRSSQLFHRRALLNTHADDVYVITSECLVEHRLAVAGGSVGLGQYPAAF